jgi:CheY-like chemotaxis protein
MPADPPPLPDLSGLTLFVVEDDPDSRDILHEVLRVAGAIVSVASNVSAALTYLSTTRYDAVISDVAMPQRDGLDLIAAIRRATGPRGGKLPAIAVTGFPERYEDIAKTLGFDAFFRKPVNFDVLCLTIRDLAGRSQ